MSWLLPWEERKFNDMIGRYISKTGQFQWYKYYKEQTLLPGSDKQKAATKWLKSKLSGKRKKHDPQKSPHKRARNRRPESKSKSKKSEEQSSEGAGMSIFSDVGYYKLPTINLAKFGKKGNSWRKQDEVMSKEYVLQGGRKLVGVANRKHFAMLSPATFSVTADSGGALSIPTVTKFGITNFNSCAQMLIGAADLVNSSTATGWTSNAVAVLRNFLYPVYQLASPWIVSDVNDANNYCGISNQKCVIRIKNATLNQVGANYSTTPVRGVIHVYQLKRDVYHDRSPLSVETILQKFTQGFNNNYDNAGNGNVLSTFFDQLPFVTVNENNFLKDYCKPIAHRKFHLTPGGETELQIYLPQKQIFSYKFLTRARVANPTVGSIAYNPVIHKKGEIFCVVEWIGGLMETSDDAGVGLENSELLFYYTHKFNYHLLNFGMGKETLGTTFADVLGDENIDIMDVYNDGDLPPPIV